MLIKKLNPWKLKKEIAKMMEMNNNNKWNLIMKRISASCAVRLKCESKISAESTKNIMSLAIIYYIPEEITMVNASSINGDQFPKWLGRMT